MDSMLSDDTIIASLIKNIAEVDSINLDIMPKTILCNILTKNPNRIMSRINLYMNDFVKEVIMSPPL